MDTKSYKRSRIMYIIEAALEYLISILVADMYLAALTRELGISESLTGIISSFISLGCVFQLCSLLIRKARPKRLVTALSILNQLLFMLLYVVPLTGWNPNVKIIVFVVVILLAYFFYNIAHPKKIDWFMSLVDNEQRGTFTAKKEAISLVVGIVFTFAMGAVIDYYKETNIKTAFIICGISIFALTILHTLTMIFTIDKQKNEVCENCDANEPKSNIFSVFKDKSIIKVTLVFVLWYIASYTAIPFYGAYKEGALAFSYTFGAVLGVIYAIVRAFFSFVWGKYADKYSFAKMLRICFGIAAIGFLINVFCVPENGHVIYTIFYICYAIAMGGINSALINLCYDYVSKERRADALAVSLAVAGVCGFLATLVVSPLVSYIQGNSNMLFGIHIYAQQVLSLIACVMTIVALLYVSISLTKVKRIDRDEENEQNSDKHA